MKIPGKFALHLKEIEQLVIKGSYEKATNHLLEKVEQYRLQKDTEQIYNCLNLLTKICDKSPEISLKTAKSLESLINEQDSWVRVACLDILDRISRYRPNLLIDLLDEIKSRLYDRDNSVRRLAVKTLGTLILNLHIDSEKLTHIVSEYTEKLMDDDWEVKLNVIRTIKAICKKKPSHIERLEPLLSMVLVHLRHEDSEIAKSSAELLKRLGLKFISKEKVFYLLLNLLHNEDPPVQKYIIWLFGEIGEERPNEIISFIPKIINFFKIDDYRIQNKVIGALTKIAGSNFKQVWASFIAAISETSLKSDRNSLGHALFQLSQDHIPKIFPIIFEELDNPSENVRETVSLVLKRLFSEYQIEVENEISKILSKTESRYWRERKNAIQLIEKLISIGHIFPKRIIMWICLELNNNLDKEDDVEVKKEIRYTLDKIHSRFPNTQEEIKEIETQISFLRKKIKKFNKIPSDFRETLNSYMDNFKFNTTEVQLNQLYDEILQKIQNFDKEINKFQYKRLAFEILEEWEETKIQIIDELTIIRSHISEMLKKKEKEYKADLKAKINVLIDKINILKAQFDYIKEDPIEEELEGELSPELFSKATLKEKFDNISLIRKNLLNLDLSIRELLINNVEFDELFKPLIDKWVSVKVEIQINLNKWDKKIKEMKDYIVEDLKENGVSIKSQKDKETPEKDIIFQIVQSRINSIVTYGFNGLKKLHQNMENSNVKLNSLIRKGQFNNAKKMIQEISSQIKAFIDETENKIDSLIEKREIFKEYNDGFNLYINPVLKQWNDSKELIIRKLRKFENNSKENLFLNQIKHYLNISNPISFEILSNHIKMDKERIKELVFNYIDEEKLDAKIQNSSLYIPTLKTNGAEIYQPNLYKQIRTVGNHLELSLRLNNTSNHDFKDLFIKLETPNYIEIRGTNFFEIDKLKALQEFQFKYLLKVNKKEKTLSSPNEITLRIFYDLLGCRRQIKKSMIALDI